MEVWTCGGGIVTYPPPVLRQELFELQLRDWRVCVSEDRILPGVLCTLPAPVHLPHLLCGTHRLRLPQPALHDGSSVSGVSELPRPPFDVPSCLCLESLLQTLECPVVTRRKSTLTAGVRELLVRWPHSGPQHLGDTGSAGTPVLFVRS